MYTKLLEFVRDVDAIVYHGSFRPHDFNESGYQFNGTFFSTSKAVASSYGKFVYEVELYRELRLFDTAEIKDCKKIFQEFKYLIDDEDFYEMEQGDENLIRTPNELNEHGDNWYAIENTPGVIKWINENYDGVWIYEGAVRNLLLFNPLLDKIKEIIPLH